MASIIYITYVDYNEENFSGVKKKISNQIKILKDNGNSVDLIVQYGKKAKLIRNNGSINFFSSFTKRFSVTKAVKAVFKNQKIDYAYIRFQFFSEDVRQMLKFLYQNSCRVLMEIPTYPYDKELHNQGLKGEIKLLIDKFYRNSCINNIDKFVSPSNVEFIFSREYIHIKNGYDFAKFNYNLNRTINKSEINIIAVASMMPSHGYDRLLYGLKNYYRKEREIKVYFHLVGTGPELKKYREIIEEFGLDSYVKIYGQKTGLDLLKIVEKCSIAVDALSSFRANINYLSTIKSREYCAWGLPCVYCTDNDIFSKEDLFNLRVPENESPINIDDIVKFFQDIYFNSGLKPNQISEKIYIDAKGKCDIKIAYKPILDYINSF